MKVAKSRINTIIHLVENMETEHKEFWIDRLEMLSSELLAMIYHNVPVKEYCNNVDHKKYYYSIKELEREFYSTHINDAEFIFDDSDYELLACGIHYMEKN